LMISGLFCFLHTLSEQIYQKEHEDDQAYKLRSSEIKSCTQINHGIHFSNRKHREHNTHDTLSGDQTGSEKYAAVCAFLLLCVRTFDLLNDVTDDTACHDTCT